MILYLSMILGILIVWLGKLNKVWLKPEFEWSIFFKTNIISLILAIIAGLVLVINQAELIEAIKTIVPIFPFTVGGLFSAVLGAGGVTLFQFLVDIANPDKNTVIGLNNK